jgi:glycosyltransferase involved in cell wall biosynthesis
MSKLKKLLIITPQDYRGYSNFRLHHIVSYFKKRCEDITVLYRYHIRKEKRTLLQSIGSLFLVNLLFERDDNLTLIRIDPLLNHKHSLGLGMLRITDPYTIGENKLKRFASWGLSLLGIFPDILITPSLLLTYLLKLRAKYDVIIGQGPWEMGLGCILKKLGRARLLVYDDRDYEPGFITTNRLRRYIVAKMERAMLKRADLVICIGNRLASLREAETGIKPVIIPNGVDYALFRGAQEKIPHPPTLFYMGYVNPWSGLDIVVEALPGIKRVIPAIRLLVAGHVDENYLALLLKRIRELNLEDNFRYLGRLEYHELINPLRESDIGLAISRPVELRRYAFPLKVIEYMAAGLPVVATSGTQAEEIVKRHNCGIGTEYRTDKIEYSLLGILTDRDIYRRLSMNAKKAAQDYDWENLLHKYSEIINKRI